ncbi:serine/threonine-protein phosphatase 7 long form homolog [Arachis ipaensis]|uniref:serine/threonine-protein phosphatase 7 long form homolog n=1 Tax=Arachis ipaensis TaxID=130454 RepID=UPI000A2B788C|nr:serine/threonine-protein phosphatase 7 long form homolog [Arachis ipaensis]
MPKKYKVKDVDRSELHIIHYLNDPDYKLRILTCNHPVPPNRYNDRVEEHLRVTGFYHVSQIGIVQCQKALVNALVERWHPDTHTFHLPIGECSVTLEDVALILGLPTDGLPVTGMTMSSFEAIEAECLLQFGVAPRKEDCVHWKFLPLLRDFVSIGQYSWGSACLAHLYRALCRASRYNCKEIDGPLTLLLGWAWIRLPYLSPLPREPRSFPLANRWRNWERGDRRYRYLKLDHFRKAFDELQEGQFVWVAYAVDRVDPNIIPPEIYMQSVVWSATVSLVSFECIEWHATNRVRRQFGFVQGVPTQEQNLDKAHGEVLTGPKNLNWVTAPSHSIWVMHWTNMYHYILSELPIPSQHPLDSYMNWYRSKFGNRLSLSNLVGEDNVGNEDMGAGNDDMDEGNQDTDEGSQDMDEDNEEHEPHISLPNPLPQEQPQSSNPFVPQTQFTPSFPMQQQYWGMSQFETGEGGSFSQLLGFMATDAAQSQYGHQPEFMPGRYSLDARYPGHTSSVASGGFVSIDDSSRSEMECAADTPEDNVKGYNLRIDPPRRSANRFTPSVFKKAAKKCKNFVKDVKWAMRK